MIELSTQAYDTRDDSQTKLLSLKEKADKELAQYTMELKVCDTITPPHTHNHSHTHSHSLIIMHTHTHTHTHRSCSV